MLVLPTYTFVSRSGPNVDNFNVSLASNSVGPGGVVSGQLTFRITAPKPFHRVSIKIVGKEETNIYKTETYMTSDRRYEKLYSSRTNVCKQHITILGGLKGSNFKGELPPGDYNFPFAFVIPANAPPTIPPQSLCTNMGQLVWRIKASININMHEADSEDMATITVTNPMPMSQYQNRQPTESIHRAKRTCCCCCDQGTSLIKMNLAQNMLVFGADKTLDGYITIDNHESKEDVQSVSLNLRRMCWIKAQYYESVPTQLVGSLSITTKVKAGDTEKRFNFSIPLPSDPTLVSCFRGHTMSHYYQFAATCGMDTLFVTNMVATNAIDSSNSCPVIVTDRPGPIVPPKQYPQYVYAPPPGGQVLFPYEAACLVPQSTNTVRPHGVLLSS